MLKNAKTNGSGRTVGGQVVGNTILQRLSQAEFDALEPHLEFVSLNLATLLQ